MLSSATEVKNELYICVTVSTVSESQIVDFMIFLFFTITALKIPKKIPSVCLSHNDK